MPGIRKVMGPAEPVYLVDEMGEEITDANPIPTDASLKRTSEALSVTISAGSALSEAIDVREYSTIIVHMSSVWTASRLSVQASQSLGGTYQPLYDELGNLIRCNGGANVVVSTSYVIPVSVAGCRFVKLWSENGAGGNTNQVADSTIGVDLKS